MKESEPKWGLSDLECEVGVVAWFVKRLRRSQRCGKCPRVQVSVDGANPHEPVRNFVCEAYHPPKGVSCSDSLSRTYIRRILPNISMVITLFVLCPIFRQIK